MFGWVGCRPDQLAEVADMRVTVRRLVPVLGIIGLSIAFPLSSANAVEDGAPEREPANERPNDDWIAFSEDLREIYAFPASRERLEDLAQRNPAPSEHMPFLMTANELEIFRATESVADRAGPFFESSSALSTFAGVHLEEGGRRYVLHLTRVGPDEDEVIRRFPDPSRLAVVVEKYSQAELVAEQERVGQLLIERFSDGTVTAMASLTRDNALMVSLSPGADAGVREEIQSLTSYPIVWRESQAPVYNTCTSRLNCNSPRRGGISIKLSTSGNTWDCSSGLPMRLGSNELFATAGHCWSNETNNSSTTTGFINSGTAGTFGTLNSRVSFLRDSTPESDSRLIDTTDSSSSNVVWSTAAQKAITVRHTYPAADNGTPVCLWGYMLPADNCGTIDTNNYSVWYPWSDTFIPTFVHMNADMTCGDGLSGGAYTSTSGSTGVGVHAGFHGGGCFFSHIHYVENDLGATLSLTP